MIPLFHIRILESVGRRQVNILEFLWLGNKKLNVGKTAEKTLPEGGPSLVVLKHHILPKEGQLKLLFSDLTVQS
jgi:hypothetical protein